MTLNQLRYFCTACRTRSITRAAAELYVTQPTISIAIRELESEFHITLFTRNGNHLELTSAGEQFYAKAQNFLRISDEMQTELSRLQDHHPVLKIGIPPMLSTIFFPEMLDAFSREYPDTPVELDEYGSVRACDLVQKEQLDIGLVNMEQYNIDKFEHLTLTREQLLYVVSPDHPRAGQTVMSMEDFQEEKIILFNADSVQNDLLQLRFERLQVTPQILMRSSQIYTTLKFVRSGGCGCFLYSSMLPQFPGYIGIPLDPPLYANVGLVWKKGRFVSHEMQLFIQFVRNRLAESQLT